jgi:2-polyprenyl-6-methoxyphenol hydroxylase-like FAD-dependent oxidoreductase
LKPLQGAAGLRVGIIGGGIAGLTAALSLTRLGIVPKVFERDGDKFSRQQGYSIGLDSGMKVMKTLGVDKSFEEAAEDMGSFGFLDATTCSSYLEMKLPETWVDKKYYVQRKKLRESLLSELNKKGIEVKWNSRLKDLEEGPNSQVKAVFEDGTSEEFDILIGADGGNSAVRKILVGDPLNWLGITQIGFTVENSEIDRLRNQYPDLQKHRTIFFLTDEGKSFFVSQSGGRLFVGFVLPMSEEALNADLKANKDDLRQFLDSHTKNFCPLVRDLAKYVDVKVGHRIRAINDREVPEIDPATQRPWKKLVKSAVTMIGDAAHPMTPYRGQGANMAMVDALSVAHSLSKLKDLNGPSLVNALRSFEAEMLARVRPIVQTSHNDALSYHSSSTGALWIRSAKFLGMRVMFGIFNTIAKYRQ